MWYSEWFQRNRILQMSSLSYLWVLWNKFLVWLDLKALMTLFPVVKECVEYSGETAPQIFIFTYAQLSAQVLGGQIFTENILLKMSIIELVGYF